MKPYLTLITLAATLTLGACSNDDTDGGDHNRGKVRLTLKLASADHATATRTNDYNATGDLIHNAYVVMVKEDGGEKVVEHIFNVTETDEFEQHQVTTIDADMNATYTFYNFGNHQDYTATKDAEGNVTKLCFNNQTITNDSTLSSTLDNCTYTAQFNNYAMPVEGLPMSNSETFFVDKDQTITLTLFRMMGKMQLTFNNLGSDEVRLRKVTLGDVTMNHGSLMYLLPRKTEGIIQCDFGSLNRAVETVTLFTCDDDDAKAITLDAGTGKYVMGKTSAPIYLNESKPVGDHKGFPLTIEMERKNEEGNWEPDNREAIIQLSAIKRNYVALVNINLTNYILKLTAHSYPPIGGYPAHVLEENGAFYATFIGGGDFEIKPTLYKYADRNNPEKWIDLNDQTQVESYSLLVTDESGIFEKKPAFDTTTGEILGAIITGKQGTATLKLTVNIITGTSADGTVTTLTYTRTIYVVAK